MNYRSAYNTARMNDNSIRREASRLMDNRHYGGRATAEGRCSGGTGAYCQSCGDYNVPMGDAWERNKLFFSDEFVQFIEENVVNER